MSDADHTPARFVLRDTSVTLLVHAVIWSALFAEVIFIFPPMASQYKEFNVRFPAAAEAGFALARLVDGHAYIWPVVLLADGAVYLMLRQAKEGRLLGRLWSICMILLPILILAWLGFSLYLSWWKLKEALAR